MSEIKGVSFGGFLPTPDIPKRNLISAALSSGIDDLQGTLYGLGGAVADTVGATGTRDWMNKQADRNQLESRLNGRADLENVEDQSLGSMPAWALYQTIKQVPNFAGAAAATLLTPEITLPAAAGRALAYVPRILGGGGMTGRVAEATAKGASVLGAQREALRAGSTLGNTLIKGGAFNYGTGVGSLYNEAVEGGNADAGVESLIKGVPYALAETAPEAMLFGRLAHGSGFQGGMLKRMGKSALTQGTSGALSELSQTAMENSMRPDEGAGSLTTDQIGSRYLNAGAAGFAAEAILGSLGGIRGPRTPRAKLEQNAPINLITEVSPKDFGQRVSERWDQPANQITDLGGNLPSGTPFIRRGMPGMSAKHAEIQAEYDSMMKTPSGVKVSDPTTGIERELTLGEVYDMQEAARQQQMPPRYEGGIDFTLSKDGPNWGTSLGASNQMGGAAYSAIPGIDLLHDQNQAAVQNQLIDPNSPFGMTGPARTLDLGSAASILDLYGLDPTAVHPDTLNQTPGFPSIPQTSSVPSADTYGAGGGWILPAGAQSQGTIAAQTPGISEQGVNPEITQLATQKAAETKRIGAQLNAPRDSWTQVHALYADLEELLKNGHIDQNAFNSLAANLVTPEGGKKPLDIASTRRVIGGIKKEIESAKSDPQLAPATTAQATAPATTTQAAAPAAAPAPVRVNTVAEAANALLGETKPAAPAAAPAAGPVATAVESKPAPAPSNQAGPTVGKIESSAPQPSSVAAPAVEQSKPDLTKPVEIGPQRGKGGVVTVKFGGRTITVKPLHWSRVKAVLGLDDEGHMTQPRKTYEQVAAEEGLTGKNARSTIDKSLKLFGLDEQKVDEITSEGSGWMTKNSATPEGETATEPVSEDHGTSPRLSDGSDTKEGVGESSADPREAGENALELNTNPAEDSGEHNSGFRIADSFAEAAGESTWGDDSKLNDADKAWLAEKTTREAQLSAEEQRRILENNARITKDNEALAAEHGINLETGKPIGRETEEQANARRKFEQDAREEWNGNLDEGEAAYDDLSPAHRAEFNDLYRLWDKGEIGRKEYYERLSDLGAATRVESAAPAEQRPSAGQRNGEAPGTAGTKSDQPAPSNSGDRGARTAAPSVDGGKEPTGGARPIEAKNPAGEKADGSVKTDTKPTAPVESKPTAPTETKPEAPAKTVAEEAKDKWEAHRAQFPQMPAHDDLTKHQKKRWEDLVNRKVDNLAAAAKIAGESGQASTVDTTKQTETASTEAPATTTTEQTAPAAEAPAATHEAINAAVEKLPSTQVKALEEELKAKRGSKVFTKRVAEQIGNYVTKGAEAVAARIRGIIKSLSEGVMAVAMIFNPNVTAHNFAFDLPRTFSMETAVKADVPTTAVDKMSVEARRTYENLAPRLMKTGKAFAIMDKNAGMVHWFNPDGSLLVQGPAISGKDKGDVLQGNSLLGAKKITPAGTYTLEHRSGGPYSEYKGKAVFALKETDDTEGVIAVHAVWVGDPKEARQWRLDKGSAEMKRISYGCINTTDNMFLSHLLPNAEKLNGGTMLVLPEERAKTGSMFPAESKTETSVETGRRTGASETGASRDVDAKEEKYESRRVGFYDSYSEESNLQRLSDDDVVVSGKGRVPMFRGKENLQLNLILAKVRAVVDNVVREAERMGIGHWANAVDTWRTGRLPPGELAFVRFNGKGYDLTLTSGTLATNSGLQGTKIRLDPADVETDRGENHDLMVGSGQHELAHIYDDVSNGGVYSTQPEMKLKISYTEPKFTSVWEYEPYGGWRIEGVGEVGKEIVALHEDPNTPLWFRNLLDYPLDVADANNDLMYARGSAKVQSEVFAQLASVFTDHKMRVWLKDNAPQTYKFMSEVFDHVANSHAEFGEEVAERRWWDFANRAGTGTTPGLGRASRIRVPNKGRSGDSSGEGGSERFYQRAASGQVTGGTGPQGLTKTAESLARERLGETGARAVNDASHFVKKLANSLRFLHDIVEDAAKQIPAAKKWYAAVQESIATRNSLQQNAERVAAMADKLPNGTGAVNDFISRSTYEQKWGYDPKHPGKTVTIDPAMQREYLKLSAEERAVVQAVFKHGMDMAAKKDSILKALGIADEFTKSARLEGPYAPLKRFGNYLGILKSAQLRAAEAADDAALVAKLKEDPAHYMVSSFDTIGQAKQFAYANDAANGGKWAFADAFEKSVRAEEGRMMPHAALQKVLSALKVDANVPTEARDAVTKMVTDMYFQTLDEHNARTSGLKRMNRAGYDSDMIRSFLSHAKAESGFLANLQHGGEINGQFYEMSRQTKNAKGYREAQDAFNMMAEHYADSLQYRETPWQDRAMAMTSAWQLATSVGYHLNNATQPFMTTVPKLAADFNDYGGAWKHVLAGYKTLASTGTWGNIDIGKVKDQGLRGALQRAADMGVLDVGMAEDLSHFERTRTGYGMVDSASGVAKRALHLLRQVSRSVEVANRVSSATAAYNMAIASGKSVQEAQDYAVNILQTTQGDFSRTGAPLLLKKLPKVTTQYKKFQLMVASLYANAFRQAFTGSDPTTKAIGKRMLAYKLFHTGAAAGVLGMPMINLVAAAFSAMGGDDEPPDLERSLRDAIGDKNMADVLLHGPLYAVGLGGLGTKLGDDKVFSIMPYGNWDFSSKSAMLQTAGSLMGPAVSQAGQFAEGIGFMGRGDYYRGVEKMMPKGVSSAMEAFRVANEGFQLKNDDVMFKPEDVNGLAMMLDAVGVPSSNMTDMKWIRSQQYEISQFYQQKTKQLEHEYVKAYEDGDSETQAKLREDWMNLQNAKDGMRHWFNDEPKALKRQPLSVLIRSPHNQNKREDLLQKEAAFSQ